LSQKAVVRCSFKSKYKIYNLKPSEGGKSYTEVPFKCKNEVDFGVENMKQRQSDKCIFHDLNFLSTEENQEKVERAFQEQINSHLSKMDNEPLLCVGYHLHELNILDREFTGSVYFNNATISGSSTVNSKFLSNVSFEDAKFSGEVSFEGAKFLGEGIVVFDGARFSETCRVSFDGAQFLGKGEVSFVDADFSSKGDVSFLNTEFSGKGSVYFTRAKFSNQRDVSFERANFSNQVGIIFEGAQFLGEGDISFRYSQFSSEVFVSFDRADFLVGGGVFFDNARFSGGGSVSFFRTQFSPEGIVSFGFVSFLGDGDVYFFKSEFSSRDHNSFAGAKFSTRIFFKECIFTTDVYFDMVDFLYPERVHFETEDLSKVSFLNSDITRVKFGEGVVWGKNNNKANKFIVMDEEELEHPPGYLLFNWNAKLEDIKKNLISFLSETLKLEWVKHDSEVKNSIYYINTINVIPHDGKKPVSLQLNLDQNVVTIYTDGKEKYQLSVKKEGDELNVYDVKIVSAENKVSAEGIKTLYRNLRENYEYRLRYDEAGQFFVREMEIKRKYREEFSTTERRYIPKKNNWLRRNFSFIGLYRNICNYGESSTKPIMWFGIIILLSTFYWFIYSINDLQIQNDFIKPKCNEDLFSCSFQRTLGDIVGFPEIGKNIDYITRISSIIILATLFLPFRRKFERRFRH
jgi:uncharacterized protein YjbI with pentapeptide repeats